MNVHVTLIAPVGKAALTTSAKVVHGHVHLAGPVVVLGAMQDIGLAQASARAVAAVVKLALVLRMDGVLHVQAASRTRLSAG